MITEITDIESLDPGILESIKRAAYENSFKEIDRKKNLCANTRNVEDPYEIWINKVTWFDCEPGQVEWRILKKWQVDDDKLYARWFCAVKSPMTYGSWEYGDEYVDNIKKWANRIK